MTRDMKIAAASAAMYAASEVYLGKKYPLKDPMPLPARMAVAGGLAFLTVVLAEKILPPDDKGTR